MEHLGIAVVALAMIVLKGAFTLLLVYVGARLAIRHERRMSNGL
jgi:hypothetical protein